MSDRAEFEDFYKKENGFRPDCTMEMIYELGVDEDDVDELFRYWQAARAQPEPSSEELRARVTELGVRYSDLKALADEMSDAADREAFELCYAEKISGVQSVLRACRSGDCYVVSEGDRLNIAWEVWQALAEKALGLLSKTASQAEQEGE